MKSKGTTLTDEQIMKIKTRLGDGISCVAISKELGVHVQKVYRTKEYLGLTQPQNITFNFTPLQEQIFLSGKLGDGNFKKNGSTNYCYRESHAEGELEYLTWKHNVIKETISQNGIKPIPKKGFNVQQMYGFSTITSPSFIEYAQMNIETVISKLDIYGLILYALDDGWCSKNTFYICKGVLTREQLELLVCRFNECGFKNVSIQKNKRENVTIPSINKLFMYEKITEIIPKETDIIIKKFKY